MACHYPVTIGHTYPVIGAMYKRRLPHGATYTLQRYCKETGQCRLVSPSGYFFITESELSTWHRLNFP